MLYQRKWLSIPSLGSNTVSCSIINNRMIKIIITFRFLLWVLSQRPVFNYLFFFFFNWWALGSKPEVDYFSVWTTCYWKITAKTQISNSFFTHNHAQGIMLKLKIQPASAIQSCLFHGPTEWVCARAHTHTHARARAPENKRNCSTKVRRCRSGSLLNLST